MNGKNANRLAEEKSPYLRQHAANPVSWHPWGDEAFREAARTDRPVFLSIGYSACHWCHVMERESFADEEVARLMNDTFISVKVDREERPDIDAYYMAVCQILTGSGGWPLTLILTPDREPLYAGTYLPKESRFGLIGLKDLIIRVAEAWKTRRPELQSSAGRIVAALREVPETPSGGKIAPAVLEQAASDLAREFDEEFGGFGSAPKFPTPHHLTFLLRQARRTGEKKLFQMVEKTLHAMHRGGIFDQLGFGFHRYSTDRRWLAPHFEKMLYDQALLVIAYSEAFQATGRADFKQTVEEILTYVQRDLRSPEGAFYTSEDADSEEEEGKFYLWESAEVEAVLSPPDIGLARSVFGLRPEGNFTQPGGRPSARNILHISRPQADVAAELGLSKADYKKQFDRLRGRLFARREGRPRPLKDTKILADWNGLMIAALARAAYVFDRAEYAEAAALAAAFITNKMIVKGELHHRSAGGEVAIPAFLDDLAFLIWGFLELYGATFETGFLSQADKLTDRAVRDFWDEKAGGFFFTSSVLHKDLPSRRKELFDGAYPSGNSVMVANLLRLGRLLGRPDLEARAGSLIEAFSGQVIRRPTTCTQFLCGLDFALGPGREVVIVGRTGAPDTRALRDILRQKYNPNTVVLFRPDEERRPPVLKLAPYAAEMKSLGGKATAYVCSNYRCERPTTEPEELGSLLV
jgi:uncharacterized protein YyaL (SSP411 family)